MKKQLLTVFLLLIFAPTTVYAGDISPTWVNPTSLESCVAAGPYPNPAGTRIWQLIADITDPDQTSTTITGLKPGTYSLVATAYNTEGVGSRISGWTIMTVTSFMAPLGADVFQPVTIENGSWLLFVGTLKADTECNLAESVNGKHGIPNTAVDWADGVTPKPYVVADCQ